MASMMTRLMDAALNLTLGSCCPGCSLPGWGVCPACKTGLNGTPHRVARPNLPRTVTAVAADWYTEPASRLVVMHKDEGAWQLAGLLGSLLAGAVEQIPPFDSTREAVLVPVPSDRSAVRRRGYDHSRELARIAARELGMTMYPLVRRNKKAEDQVGRTQPDRLNSQRFTMAATPARKLLPVIVTDDVVTTGATLAETIRALRAAGHLVVGAAVICDTPRYDRGAGG